MADPCREIQTVIHPSSGHPQESVMILRLLCHSEIRRQSLSMQYMDLVVLSNTTLIEQVTLEERRK